jgi:hypothetical protein
MSADTEKLGLTFLRSGLCDSPFEKGGGGVYFSNN